MRDWLSILAPFVDKMNTEKKKDLEMDSYRYIPKRYSKSFRKARSQQSPQFPICVCVFVCVCMRGVGWSGEGRGAICMLTQGEEREVVSKSSSAWNWQPYREKVTSSHCRHSNTHLHIHTWARALTLTDTEIMKTSVCMTTHFRKRWAVKV